MLSKHARKGGIQWTRGELWVRRCFVGFIVLLALLAIWFSYVDESERKVLATGADVRVPVAHLKAGRLCLFAYAVDPSTTTQVAVQRGEDGIIRVAFGSCRSCPKFDHYKWFNKLVCRHCNHTVKLPNPDDKPTEKSGCTSVALPYDLEAGQLVVRGEAIVGEFYRWYRPSTGQK